MTAAGSAGEAVTPGQAAYEAHHAVIHGQIGLESSHRTYERLTPQVRIRWEAGAEAAASGLRAELEALAAFWAREYVTDDGWPQVCAKQLLDVLGAQAAIAAQQPQPAPESVPWRQGRTQPRNIYARTGGGDWKADLMIGQLDTPAAAAEAVRAHNAALGEQPAPELAAAMAERDQARADRNSARNTVAEMLDHPAMCHIQLSVIERWRTMSGLKP